MAVGLVAEQWRKKAGQESITAMPIRVAPETKFFHLNLPHLPPVQEACRKKKKKLIPAVHTHTEKIFPGAGRGEWDMTQGHRHTLPLQLLYCECHVAVVAC